MSAVAWPAPPAPPPVRSLWLVSLIDTFSLLLCFFILIFSLGTPDTQRFREIAASLSKHLPITGTRAFAPPAPASDRAPVLPAEFALNLDYLASLIEGRMERQPALAGVRLERRFDRLLLVPPAGAIFAATSATPREAAAPLLGAIADLVAHVPNRLQVQAGVGAAGGWDLALARAQAIAAALRQSGYPGDPPALAAMQETPLVFVLLPVAGGAR
jgi:chemotaxis protein MotB